MNPIWYKQTGSNRAAWVLFALIPALTLLPSMGNAAATNRPPNAVATNSLPKVTATTGSAPAISFETFRIVAQRNIFNPNRYSGRTGRRNPSQMAGAPGFALVGTIIYEKGAFALFDGSDAQYKKTLKLSDTIADYRVVEITPSHVKLETGTNQTTLSVGAQMKIIDGKWELADGTESVGKSPDTSSGAPASETATEASSEETSSGGGSGADAILRRLMQQREKELQK
ncbi:MAG: hypothetical protein ABSC38_03480 [Verrucomicrobiia bacterium]